MHRTIIILMISLLGAAAAETGEETVYRHPDYSGSLGQRWQWAERKARDTRDIREYWIVYSFEKMMNEHSFTGSWRGVNDTRTPLGELIYGPSRAGETAALSNAELIRREARTALETINNDEHPQQQVMKEIAVCFHYGDKGAVDDIRLSNMSLPVDLDGDPLFWLGKIPVEESVAFLAAAYRGDVPVSVKKELITAVGIHPPSDFACTFLITLVKNEKQDTLREQSLFWLSRQDERKALPVIIAAAEADDSPDVREKAVFAASQIRLPEAEEALIRLAESASHVHVREQAVFWMGQNGGRRALKKLKELTETDTRLGEKAVFAISRMEGNEAEQTLIDLAHDARTPAIRKKAIFWLGQKASEKARAAVQETVFDADESEIQEAALFAVSQMPADLSVPELIRIGNTHPRLAIRKKAIFWLGQCDDKRAVEYLSRLITAH
ncbi:HEAT repeat domain-containing protein [bacterium]|nr:HEAT repeat domain-containing protein [bacterium]